MLAVDLIVPGSLATLTGGYIYDRRIFEGLTKLGWRTTVHSLDTSFPIPSEAALEDARAVLRTLPENRLVVIDGLALTGLAPLLATGPGRPRFVALIHHPLALETGLSDAASKRLRSGERAALAHTDHVIVTSRWTRDALGAYGVDRDRISVIEPGVDREPLPALQRAGPSLRLLTVGTVTPRKGHALLVDALNMLEDRDWSLRCAGSLDRDEETVAALRARIDRYALGDRVQLLGELTPAAVAREYAEADLFVLASYLEGYGMVIAEAVANGLPTVAAAAGAIPQTLPPGAGVLVEPGNAAALARALAALCDDRGKLAALTDGARAASSGIPTWAHAVTRFAAALEAASR